MKFKKRNADQVINSLQQQQPKRGHINAVSILFFKRETILIKMGRWDPYIYIMSL